MTTRWRPEFDPEHLYFVTTTAAERTCLFRRDIIRRILIDGLYFVNLMNRVTLYAFVVMPNHVHVIIQCPPDLPPKDWARAYKADAARLIVRHYQVEGNQPALEALRRLVTRPDKQEYKVWEDGYRARPRSRLISCSRSWSICTTIPFSLIGGWWRLPRIMRGRAPGFICRGRRY